MSGGACIWRCRQRAVSIDERPLLMGILNVTPDSFSDGGRYADAERAVARGVQMAEEGAEILDIGGESTRPGAEPVPPAEERRRVVPVVSALVRQTAALVSVDTRNAGVAEAALGEGAHIVNDVSALTHDPGMADVVRKAQAGVVLMHMRGEPRTMQEAPRYGDVVAEVKAWLAARIRAAVAAGIAEDALVVDPGIGFGKTVEHNLCLLAGLPALAEMGRPVLVGVSRKRFVGTVTGREVGERLAGTLAAVVFCVLRGARILRVHDVRECRDAVQMAVALKRETGTC